MLVLPEPVMPWRRTVFAVQELISLIARFWASLRGLSNFSESTVCAFSLVRRRFFVIPRGRMAWTTVERGQR